MKNTGIVLALLCLLFAAFLGGFFLGRIPLLKRLKWREVVTCKGVWGSLSEQNDGSLPATQAPLLFPIGMGSVEKPYFEAGFGVENIFRMVRVDCVWRLSHRHARIGAHEAPDFAVNASLHLSF